MQKGALKLSRSGHGGRSVGFRRRKRNPMRHAIWLIPVAGLGAWGVWWMRAPVSPHYSNASSAAEADEIESGLVDATGPSFAVPSPSAPAASPAIAVSDTSAAQEPAAVDVPSSAPEDAPASDSDTVASGPVSPFSGMLAALLPAQAEPAPQPELVAANPALDAVRRKVASDDTDKLLEARRELNLMLQRATHPLERTELRNLLDRVGQELMFSRRQTPNDPLLDTYVVASGDVLVHIAREFKVPHEVIMQMNGITDARRIREGQKLKAPRGPFHARISLSEFRLDLLLQDTVVRSFPVGIGKAQSTPAGLWRVSERLANPTYYPPASNPDRRIIHADDPDNPLGEYWIALEGIEGGAVGQEGFGIHGTIEPDSIGKAASAGCIRMQADDIALVYGALAPGHSTVITQP